MCGTALLALLAAVDSTIHISTVTAAVDITANAVRSMVSRIMIVLDTFTLVSCYTLYCDATLYAVNVHIRA
jgi:hypothetical protein